MAGSNMQMEPGTISTAQGFFVGAYSQALTVLGAPSELFALRNITDLLRSPQPIAISQIRMKVWTSLTATAPWAFQIDKITGYTVTHSVGGTAITARRKKTSGYPDIPATEVAGYIANTGAISGGTFVAPGARDAIDVMVLSNFNAANDFPSGQSVWKPHDNIPVVLDKDEGLLLRTLASASTGTWMFFVGIEGYRI